MVCTRARARSRNALQHRREVRHGAGVDTDPTQRAPSLHPGLVENRSSGRFAIATGIIARHQLVHRREAQHGAAERGQPTHQGIDEAPALLDRLVHLNRAAERGAGAHEPAEPSRAAKLDRVDARDEPAHAVAEDVDTAGLVGNFFAHESRQQLGILEYAAPPVVVEGEEIVAFPVSEALQMGKDGRIYLLAEETHVDESRAPVRTGVRRRGNWPACAPGGSSESGLAHRPCPTRQRALPGFLSSADRVASQEGWGPGSGAVSVRRPMAGRARPYPSRLSPQRYLRPRGELKQTTCGAWTHPARSHEWRWQRTDISCPSPQHTASAKCSEGHSPSQCGFNPAIQTRAEHAARRARPAGDSSGLGTVRKCVDVQTAVTGATDPAVHSTQLLTEPREFDILLCAVPTVGGSDAIRSTVGAMTRCSAAPRWPGRSARAQQAERSGASACSCRQPRTIRNFKRGSGHFCKGSSNQAGP